MNSYGVILYPLTPFLRICNLIFQLIEKVVFIKKINYMLYVLEKYLNFNFFINLFINLNLFDKQ